jgi:1,4-alpha-glucan branching enzyme
MAKAKIPKQKVTFELQSPEAKEVLLASDFTEWAKEPLALKKRKDGTWSKEVSLPCGLYEYRFIVDGQWVTDPQARSRHANPFGTENSVVLVSVEAAQGNA